MKRQDYNNKWNRVSKSIPEINSGKTKVSMVGYVSRHQQIQTLIDAGKRLDKIRGRYDLQEDQDVDIDDLQLDPTRSLAFDLAEASQILNNHGVMAVDLEHGIYLDMDGKAHKISDLNNNEVAPEAPSEANKGLDTVSRSVSSPLTPEKEVTDEKTK